MNRHTLDELPLGGILSFRLNSLADHRCFADHDAGAAVDDKTLSNLGAGVDVDAGQRVRDLGYDPRQQEGAPSR